MTRDQGATAALSHLNLRLYHALRESIDPDAVCPGGEPYVHVDEAIARTAARLVEEPDLFRRPARYLFTEIRWCFPLTKHALVWELVTEWLAAADAHLAMSRRDGLDCTGRPLRCPVYTRQGRPCERQPLPSNGYCPSHQHLAVDPVEMQPA